MYNLVRISVSSNWPRISILLSPVCGWRISFRQVHQKLHVKAYAKLGGCKLPSVTAFWKRIYVWYANESLKNQAVSWASLGSEVWNCSRNVSPCDMDCGGGRRDPSDTLSKRDVTLGCIEVTVRWNTSENRKVRNAFSMQIHFPFMKSNT